MEENIEVIITETYYDLELEKNIECGKKRWITEKRAKELDILGLIRIKQIVKSKVVHK